jgi:hypothetical protein
MFEPRPIIEACKSVLRYTQSVKFEDSLKFCKADTLFPECAV